MKALAMGRLNTEKKWVFPLVMGSLVCIFLFATSFNMGLVSSVHTINSILSKFPSRVRTNQTSHYFAEVKIDDVPPPPPLPSIPKFAYLISGSRGDIEKLWRTLHALYHPWNYYVVHLDLESPPEERLELESRVEKHPIFAKIGNVYVNKKSNMVTYRGPTMVANTLHACAIVLKKYNDWDWFINLSASDYPLVTQDDLLYTFTDLKRELNFIEHTSRLGWKTGQRAMPLFVDPGLYQTTKSDIFRVAPNRNLPTAFRLFTGSAWMILSRAFVEYLVWGWDNLPRTLLMYYSNFLSSPEGYFHTVICNAPEFVPTVVNHDMHYISWDTPPKQHPHTLTINDTAKMIASGAPFARKFNKDTPILDKIDRELLRRRNGSFTPGGWCKGKPRCSKVGNTSKLKPGRGAERLRSLIGKVVLSPEFSKRQCI
ncbi:hypothetical protein BUALT_Bualt18G0050200 [Buddleja alternifolia]|uniref:Uncharacterized protein n=1 Tax=Buddleja alternifolia TaxID=168488 RepID=A0AAV6W3E3_9LAMI|nr:hypothetical protein BUALT_Bualt18G0050200 [Buddleja alternifolia]